MHTVMPMPLDIGCELAPSLLVLYFLLHGYIVGSTHAHPHTHTIAHSTHTHTHTHKNILNLILKHLMGNDLT